MSVIIDYLSRALNGRSSIKLCIVDDGCPTFEVLYDTRLFTVYDFVNETYNLMTLNSRGFLKSQKISDDETIKNIKSDSQYERLITETLENYEYLRSLNLQCCNIYKSNVYLSEFDRSIPLIISRRFEDYKRDNKYIASADIVTLEESIFYNPDDIHNNEMFEKMIDPLRLSIDKLPNTLRGIEHNMGLIFTRVNKDIKFEIDLFICEFNYYKSEYYNVNVRLNSMIYDIGQLESRYNSEFPTILEDRLNW